ncbi:hypothetical protein ACEZCY_14530 [Streptacidiphilus sp. N1-12]|uniref:Uncharacterized protein n=2 Tax=Streptacidiphilus alkalitolerans TaxID=3342712 RepID=A0ABV6V9S5_9ACTN
MPEPTEEQLLHLVDRAENGTLLAAEALLLRNSIRRYAATERAVLSVFNASMAVVTSAARAFQQLGLLPEQPATDGDQLLAASEVLGQAQRPLNTPGALFAEVAAGCERQLSKWGGQHRQDGTNPLNRDYANHCRATTARAAAEHRATWSHVFVEHVAAALAETSWPLLRAKLVKAMAVGAAWITEGDQRPDATGVPAGGWESVPYAVAGQQPTALQLAAVRAAGLPAHNVPDTAVTTAMVNAAIDHLVIVRSWEQANQQSGSPS